MESRHGVAFDVEIYENLVYKTPRDVPARFQHKRSKVTPVRMQEIAELQTELSELVEGVLPAWVENGRLVMPRAPGIPGHLLSPEHTKRAYVLRDALVAEVRKHGYTLKDTGKQNLTYDPEADRVYVVDFHKCVREGQQARYE